MVKSHNVYLEVNPAEENQIVGLRGRIIFVCSFMYVCCLRSTALWMVSTSDLRAFYRVAAGSPLHMVVFHPYDILRAGLLLRYGRPVTLYPTYQ